MRTYIMLNKLFAEHEVVTFRSKFETFVLSINLRSHKSILRIHMLTAVEASVANLSHFSIACVRQRN